MGRCATVAPLCRGSKAVVPRLVANAWIALVCTAFLHPESVCARLAAVGNPAGYLARVGPLGLDDLPQHGLESCAAAPRPGIRPPALRPGLRELSYHGRRRPSPARSSDGVPAADRKSVV